MKILFLLLLTGCSVYDESLLKPGPVIVSEAGHDSQGGTGGSDEETPDSSAGVGGSESPVGGSGGGASGTGGSSSRSDGGGSGGEPIADAGAGTGGRISEEDAGPRCGNGILDPGESCDPASPIACSCDDKDPCTTDLIQGESCSIRCEHTRDLKVCPICGDKMVTGNETCDPPNGGSCTSYCQQDPWS